MKADNRTHLVSLFPCGCCVAIITTKDPKNHYESDQSDIAEFYRSAGKAEKNYKCKMTVKEIKGRPLVKWAWEGCSSCPKAKKRKGAAK